VKRAPSSAILAIAAPKLKYECVIQSKLADAADGMAGATTAAEVRPHLRNLPGLALVLPDRGGELLLDYMQPFFRDAHSPSPPHAPLSPTSPTVHTRSSSSLTSMSPRWPSSATASPLLGQSRRFGTIGQASDGGDAADRGQEQQQFPQPHSPTLTSIRAALEATLAIALELQKLHSRGLVHKKLDPASILITPPSSSASNICSNGDLRVQFLDLSFASSLLKDRAEPDLNLSLHSAKLWLYSSPESSTFNRNIDARSDLYSLGCVFFQLLTERPPFAAEGDALEMIHMHLAKAPPSIIPRGNSAAAQPELFAALQTAQAIAEKLMQKQADDRSATVKQRDK
jgi:hypothetical protein